MTAIDPGLPRYPFSTRGDRLAEELRSGCPMLRVTTNAGDEAWLVTGHAEVRQVLSGARFARAQVADGDSPVQDVPLLAPELLDAMPYLRRAGMYDEIQRSLHDMADLPDPWLRAVIQEAVEETVAQGAPCDLQRHFSEPVAGRVMCRLLGLPESDLSELKVWADTDLTMRLPEETVHRNWGRLRDHMLEQFERDGLAAATGLLPRLVTRNRGEGALTPEQLANILGVVFVAGYEDLASFLGVASFHLAQMPQVLARLRGEPETVDGDVEELLRYSVVLGNALARIATEDTDLAGHKVRTGEMVLVSTDAANFDTARFAEPHAYDPGRRPNPHVRFGHGPNYCPGARLTRRVSALAFVALAGLGDLRLAVPPREVEWVPDRMAITPVAVPVLWEDPAATARAR
ncbi:cytochrome P450 [Nocardiopsis ganjiahuensis]|uniref:cytochrome P450 n=1 Tax=Nocardiopsis ganjiahuensis TaxID=239984 RepID=UPI00034A2C88|nr:cytochrome P450 [Nocardiopsis ganjiahuensis]